MSCILEEGEQEGPGPGARGGGAGPDLIVGEPNLKNKNIYIFRVHF